ncbi:MAG: histidine kinase, partial [Deltaproteobacteria bacterium]
PAQVVFRVRDLKDMVQFDVIDNGIGMDSQTRDKIFTLFFSTKANRGTGLGLFIANKIVCQHGGSIHVDSRPGRGSRFSIRIPRKLSRGKTTPGSDKYPPS